MAKIDLKFLDKSTKGSFIQAVGCNAHHEEDKNIRIMGVDFIGNAKEDEEIPVEFDIWLDISTAIKFAKTIRTEINKIKEVQDGKG